jgi:His-Xaa-Ser system protein HxsD
MGSTADGDGVSTFELIDGAIDLVVDLRCYHLSAIKKAAYRFADRFTTVLGSAEHDSVGMSLRFKPSISAAAARDAVHQFFQELLDQELRQQIAEETEPLRTLILAHAFSNLDLVERGE